MEVVLVDDEEIDLFILEKHLKRYSQIKNIRKYSDPYLALKEIQINKPDLVFMDIEMWGMNGLEFAEKLSLYDTEIKVVFVTSHDTYAYDAFQFYPFDYILKPISTERLEKTIKRFLDHKNKKRSDKS